MDKIHETRQRGVARGDHRLRCGWLAVAEGPTGPLATAGARNSVVRAVGLCAAIHLGRLTDDPAFMPWHRVG
jgi:hypothetical protein